MTAARQGRETTLDALAWHEIVGPGDLVIWAQATAEPTPLVMSLLAKRSTIGGFRAFVGIGNDTIGPGQLDHVAFTSYCGSGANRSLGLALNILPIPYADLASTLGKQGPILLITLAPGSDEDHFSFGPAGDYTADLISQARFVIADVNAAAPRTGTGFEVRRTSIDLIIRTDRPLAEMSAARAGDVEIALAQRVAGLIDDGATLQIGLGAVPNAVLAALRDHRHMGVHSGLITDEVAELALQGVVTNDRKSIDRGVTVTGLLAGSSRLMHWAHANSALQLRAPSYTHDSVVLASIDRLAAINSAIEVDLSGQINAEVAGGRYVGAIGGAGAFLRGARASYGGLPIIAMPSMAGSRSRIVATLSGPVSTARSDAGIVVTEHGVADLRGMNLQARRQALIAIASPSFRNELDQGPLISGG